MGRITHDDIFREKRGRALDEAKALHTLKRAATLSRHGSSRGVTKGGNVGGSRQAPSGGPGGSREAVLKSVSWLKSRGAVAGSHRYISRNRVQD